MEYPWYCFSSVFGSFVVEAEYAKELGVYLFYDEDNDVFLDKDNNVVDITGQDILPRTGVLQAERLVNAIYEHGGKSTFVKKGDYEKILNWPNYISTKRHNIVISGQEILDDGERIIREFGPDRVFFKTKNKNYSQIISVEELLKKEGNFYEALKAHKDDDFIISDVVNIMEDEFGSLEYRGYVVNGQLNNVSRVHDYLVGFVSSDIIDFMEGIVTGVKDTDFPKSFVVDVFVCKGEDGKQYLDLLECNPFVASGTYLYNSVFGRIGDLNHMPMNGDLDPYKTIPTEKMKYGPVEMYSKDSKVQGRPSICYELPGGFAADLVSYAMFGTGSKGMFIHFDTTRTLDPTNINVDEMTMIESDDDMHSSKEHNVTVNELVKQFIKSKKIKNNSDAENEEN